MKVLTIQLPEETELTKVKMIIAVSLFDKGILSSGQAAEIAGVSRRLFLEQVGNFGVSVFGESEDDLRNLNDLEI